jgi:hypothetical protein
MHGLNVKTVINRTMHVCFVEQLKKLIRETVFRKVEGLMDFCYESNVQ